jgi:NitT/TauT family transport system substrate-binding protein
MKRRHALAALLIAPLAFAASVACAEDTVKVAVSMRGNWENAAGDLGERAGIFKKHGIVLDKVYTQGTGETVQVVISGSVEVGLGIGASAVMAAFAKGAPIRVLGSSTTGTNDLFWYVRADSPIKSLADSTPATTMSYSTQGSSSQIFALAALKHANGKAKLTATGSQVATLTQVMSGQIEIGFAVPPIGFQALEDGKIRIIGRASDVPETRDQSVRLMAVNADRLKQNPELFARFVKAFAESVDWMYSGDPKVDQYYEELSKTPAKFTKKLREEFYLKPMLDPYHVSGIEPMMADAVAYKFMPVPLTADQLKELIQVPKR